MTHILHKGFNMKNTNQNNTTPVNFFDDYSAQPAEVSVAIQVITNQIVKEVTEKINSDYLNK